MDTSFRLQIIKENGNFIVPMAQEIELDDVKVHQIKNDLKSWMSQYETEIENGAQFVIRSGEKEIILQ